MRGRNRLGGVLVAAILAVGPLATSLAAPAAAAAGGAQWGIADQNWGPGLDSTDTITWLQTYMGQAGRPLRNSRLIVPYDSWDQYFSTGNYAPGHIYANQGTQRWLLDLYYFATDTRFSDRLVVLSTCGTGANNCGHNSAPGYPEYTTGFNQLRNWTNSFSPIQHWGAWNEPEGVGTPAYFAAAYPVWMKGQCLGCDIVGGDFATDNPTGSTYLTKADPNDPYNGYVYWLRTFLNALDQQGAAVGQPHLGDQYAPNAWSFHSYTGATNHGTLTTAANTWRSLIWSGVGNGGFGSPPLWMDEGGIRLDKGTINGDYVSQAIATQKMIQTAQDTHALDRIYYYNASIETISGAFDSGLRAANQSSAAGLRPSFCVLSNINPANCSQNIWAKGTGNNP